MSISLLVSTLSLSLPLFVSYSEILMSVVVLISTDPPKFPHVAVSFLPFLSVVSQSLIQQVLLVRSFVVLGTIGSDPEPNLRASLVGRVRVRPQRTTRNARRSICQRSGSSFGLVAAAWAGNAGTVVIAAYLLHRWCLLVPRLLIVKEGAGLLLGLRLGSCLGRRRLCWAAWAVAAVDVMVAVAVGGRSVADAGVGEVGAADDCPGDVGRRKPVPVAAAAVAAHLSARHSQGLHS
jgi:hypothetical protein